MKLIDGRKIHEEVIESLRVEINDKGITPKLAIIQIGSEAASNIYISMKTVAARRTGIEIELFNFKEFEIGLIPSLLNELNARLEINGIIIQLPVPGIQTPGILNEITALKDVDGLGADSLGTIWHNDRNTHLQLGATPKAILKVLDEISVDQNIRLEEFLVGKNIVIINHNILIGRPLAGVLLNYNASVSILHEYTRDIDLFLAHADIIITATGKRIIDRRNTSILKDGVVIIDSGYSIANGRSQGDVDLEALSNKASYATPVPGGIGPIGVAMLMRNTLDAYFIQQGSPV